MAFLHLVRHGQADTRGNDYDRLTDRGFEQAALLAEYYAGAGVRVDYIAHGTLRRQKETAGRFREVYGRRGLPVPEAAEIPGLDEFSPALWQRIGVDVRARDEEFDRLFEKWKQLRATSERKAAFVFVKLTAKIIEAWIQGKHSAEDIETFESFRRRVEAVTESLPRLKRDSNLFLFTSGTPISVLIGRVLNLTPEMVLKMVGWVYNSSVTTMYLHRDRLELITANGVPHLPNPKVRTLI